MFTTFYKRFLRAFVPIIALLGLVFQGLCAQTDSPISSRFDLPLLLNPAKAGLGGEIYGDHFSDHHFKLNYKNQFSGAFSNSSLKILSGSYEGRFFKKSMAVGVDVYSNTLNQTAIQDLSVMLTYAYHWSIAQDPLGNATHLLSFGVQAGIRHWAFDISKMQTGSMYDPSYVGGYNPALRPEYALEESSRNVFDLQGGLQYSGTLIAQSLFLNAGFSAFHLTQPQTNFLLDGVRTDIRWLGHANLIWRSGAVPLSTHAQNKGVEMMGGDRYVSEVSLGGMYSYQGPCQVIEVSAMYRMFFSGDISLGAGLAFRTVSKSKVFSPLISLDAYGFMLQVQCDLYASTGGGYNNLFALGLGYRF